MRQGSLAGPFKNAAIKTKTSFKSEGARVHQPAINTQWISSGPLELIVQEEPSEDELNNPNEDNKKNQSSDFSSLQGADEADMPSNVVQLARQTFTSQSNKTSTVDLEAQVFNAKQRQMKF